MNQQRSRRFRSAQEAKEKEADKQELYAMLKKQNGGVLPPETLEAITKKAFDSNSITPGTPFMDILAGSLRYWCAYKLNTDPGWAKMKVIISDASVPGEGEHKIMNFVRSQRASPEYNPNTRHVIYGLDADLIMLGLATHEPHFRVLREDVFFQQGKDRTCRICGQKGHEAAQCRGEAKKDDSQDKPMPEKPFIWLHVPVLREYLAVELHVAGLPFKWDQERAIDDWVFMCSFVGNDFLPHLPALEIRDNSIDTLTAIWRDNLPHMGGFLTKDGEMNLERTQLILEGLAKQEDGIFRRRKEAEDRREAGFKRRKLNDQRNGRNNNNNNNHNNNRHGADQGAPTGLPHGLTYDMIVNQAKDANQANKSAAAVLKNQIQGLMSKQDGNAEKSEDTQTSPSALGKRKASTLEESAAGTPGSDSQAKPPAEAKDEAPEDTVRLWEEGYADRYYEQKFHVDPKDIEFRRGVARSYVEGLAWVLKYYFQGCASWEWYYPYHYAPFAEDFVGIKDTKINFAKGRTAKPFEQLLSVQPAASKHVLPEQFHDLMTDPESEIIEFYPEDFEVDLNGKKMAWQGVALLPFIDMSRLLAAAEKKYPLLSAADTARNEPGRDVLILSEANQELYDDIISNFYSKKQGAPRYVLNPRASQGLSGTVEKMPDYLPHGTLEYPLDRKGMPDLDDDRSLT